MYPSMNQVSVSVITEEFITSYNYSAKPMPEGYTHIQEFNFVLLEEISTQLFKYHSDIRRPLPSKKSLIAFIFAYIYAYNLTIVSPVGGSGLFIELGQLFRPPNKFY